MISLDVAMSRAHALLDQMFADEQRKIITSVLLTVDDYDDGELEAFLDRARAAYEADRDRQLAALRTSLVAWLAEGR